MFTHKCLLKSSTQVSLSSGADNQKSPYCACADEGEVALLLDKRSHHQGWLERNRVVVPGIRTEPWWQQQK